MGNFYENITLEGPEQAAIVAHLRKAGHKAVVAPTLKGFTVVFNEEHGEAELPKLAMDLSGAFRCPALAVLDADDDVLLYWLVANGAVIDRYDSRPRMGLRGDAKRVAATFGAEAAVDKVETALRKKYTVQVDRHADLVQALGLPEYGLGLGYHYIHDNGEVPPELEGEEDKLITVGD